MPVEGANRRSFIAGLCGAAAWPVAAAAQSVMPVVGFVGLSSPEGFPDQVAAFRSGLSEAGHVEDRDVAIECRWAYVASIGRLRS